MNRFVSRELERIIDMLERFPSLFVSAVIVSVIGFAFATDTATETPLPPQNLMSPPAAVTDSTILLLWDKPANIDQIPFSQYCVYRDGVQVGETTRGGFNATGLAPDTAYTFTVKAKDKRGVLSAAGNALKISTESKIGRAHV